MYFVKLRSNLERHSVGIVELAQGVPWSTENLNILVHAPIVKDNGSSSPIPCI